MKQNINAKYIISVSYDILQLRKKKMKVYSGRNQLTHGTHIHVNTHTYDLKKCRRGGSKKKKRTFQCGLDVNPLACVKHCQLL